MKKLNDWMSSPVTWGSYLKFGGIVTAISLLIYGVAMAYIFWDSIVERLDTIISTIREKFDR